MLNSILSFFGLTKPSIDGYTDEDLEELRMLARFEPLEICRLHRVFLSHTGDKDKITKEVFLSIKCIDVNPLRERVSGVFGFDKQSLQSALAFKEFLIGVAIFNSPGLYEQKLRAAFRLQDVDDDGSISRQDLNDYLRLLMPADNVMIGDEEIAQVVDQVFEETSADGNNITFADFQRTVGPTDFQTKMHLPF